MIKMEGRLLNLGTVDSCGRKFAEDYISKQSTSMLEF